MKICAACCDELPQEKFSKKQWKLKQHQRRCTDCIDANRDVQLKASPGNNMAGLDDDGPSSHDVDDDCPSCWICLGEGSDEQGKPLVRGCSCRGNSGFAHLSCIVKYAEQKSRDIESVNGEITEFKEPWVHCPNCKQRYTNEVALNLATAMVTFAGNNYPDNEAMMYEALHVKLSTFDLCYDLAPDRLNEAKTIADAIVALARKIRQKYLPLPKRIVQIEASAHTILGRINYQDGIIEAAMKNFEMSRELSKEIGFSHGVATADANMALLKSKSKDANNNVSTEESIDKIREAYKQSLGTQGEAAPTTIQAGVNAAIQLRSARHTIEAERLLPKLALISKRVHGPDHTLTQWAESSLQSIRARYVSVETDQLPYQALQYEDDGENCIVRGPLKNKDGSPRNALAHKTMSVASKDILPTLGTPVICHGLVKANHLNGKIGDVRSLDIVKNRLGVHFEDKRLKPCLVKPENVRILFEVPDEDE